MAETSKQLKACRGPHRRRRRRKKRYHTGPSISKHMKNPGKGRGRRLTSVKHSGVLVSSIFGAPMGPYIMKKKLEDKSKGLPAWVRRKVAEERGVEYSKRKEIQLEMS